MGQGCKTGIRVLAQVNQDAGGQKQEQEGVDAESGGQAQQCCQG